MPDGRFLHQRADQVVGNGVHQKHGSIRREAAARSS